MTKGACADPLIDKDSLSVDLSGDIATNVTLDLLVEGPADVTVTLKAKGAPTVETTTWPNIEGAASLPIYGLRPDTTYTAYVTATAGANSCSEEMVSVTTGSLPPSIPTPTLDTEGDAFGAWTLLGWIDDEDPTNTGALILDEGGAVVWYWLAPLGVAANVTWDDDSSDILVRSGDRSAPDDSMVYRVSIDGEVTWQHRYPKAHHEIGQAPDIDFAFVRAVPRMIDGETVVGDEIVEIAHDGTEHVVWNAFECLPSIEHHASWEVSSSPLPGHDWTHTNSLRWCAEDNSWLISTYYLHEVHKIRRADCSSVWVLDGDSTGGGTIHLPAAADHFGPQHGADCTDAGVILFDNGEGARASRGLALDFDEDALSTGSGTASARWSVRHPEGSQTSLLGSTDLLPDGSVLLGWGGLGETSVVDPNGDTVWRVTVDHATLGTAERRESLYGP